MNAGNYWHCGKKRLTMKKQVENPRDVSQAENCVHVLRGLISYHVRMTMGNYPERDFYLSALRYALELAEAEMQK